MIAANIFIAIAGLIIGFVAWFVLARFLVLRWINHDCPDRSPDYIASRLRGQAFGTIGWGALVVVILLLVDVFYFSQAGTLYEFVSSFFRDYPNDGKPTWVLWGGWLLGILLGVASGAAFALRKYAKCRHITVKHLITGHS